MCFAIASVARCSKNPVFSDVSRLLHLVQGVDGLDKARRGALRDQYAGDSERHHRPSFDFDRRNVRSDEVFDEI